MSRMLAVVGLSLILLAICIETSVSESISNSKRVKASPAFRGFITVLTQARSSSTTLTAKVLHSCPCVVDVGEVFKAKRTKVLKDDDRHVDRFMGFLNATGERYMPYKNMYGMPVEGIRDFGKFLLDTYCPEQTVEAALEASLDVTRKEAARKKDDFCKGRCFVGLKVFQHHLHTEQHQMFWSAFNASMTTVILERDVESRWRSEYIATTEHDWSNSGHDAKHASKIANTIVPDENIEACNQPKAKRDKAERERDIGHPESMCNFREIHRKWYEFLHREHPDAVSLTFEESIEDNGRPALGAVLNATGQFTGVEVSHLQQALSSVE